MLQQQRLDAFQRWADPQIKWLGSTIKSKNQTVNAVKIRKKRSSVNSINQKWRSKSESALLAVLCSYKRTSKQGQNIILCKKKKCNSSFKISCICEKYIVFGVEKHNWNCHVPKWNISHTEIINEKLSNVSIIINITIFSMEKYNLLGSLVWCLGWNDIHFFMQYFLWIICKQRKLK